MKEMKLMQIATFAHLKLVGVPFGDRPDRERLAACTSLRVVKPPFCVLGAGSSRIRLQTCVKHWVVWDDHLTFVGLGVI